MGVHIRKVRAFLRKAARRFLFPHALPAVVLAVWAGFSSWTASPVVAASTRMPGAAVTSVGVAGEISESQRLVLYNALQAALSQRYQLIPREALDKAEQQAFQKLKFDECVEEPCLRLIQEFLHINRLFFLQVVREGGFTQLSLTLIRRDDKIVRAYSCQGCEIADLSSRVGALAVAANEADLANLPTTVTSRFTVRVKPEDALVEVDGEPRGMGPEFSTELTPGVHVIRVSHPSGKFAPEEREIEIQSNEQKELFILLESTEVALARRKTADKVAWWNTKWKWALGLGIATAVLAIREADSIDESNDKQNNILQIMAATTSWNDYVALRNRLQSEEENAKDHETNAQIGLVLSALLLGSAAWIYYDPPEASTVTLVPASLYGKKGLGINLVVRW